MYYKLSPCPFCGGKAIFDIISTFYTHTSVGYEYTIKCSECGCSPFKERARLEICMSENSGEIYPTGETQVKQSRLVKAWNRRTTEKGGEQG